MQNGEDDLKEYIVDFLRWNSPWVQMRGGSTAIRDLDREIDEATVLFGGACSGYGVSPMTIQAIKTHMVKKIPEINEVHVDTGMGGNGGMGGDSRGGSPSFPGGTSDGATGIEDDQGL